MPRSHDRVVPGRIAQARAGVASSVAARTRKRLADVALGQVPVERQEDRVVRAGPAGLEAREDVVGARGRLQRRQRFLRVVPHGGRDEVQAVLEMVGRAAAQRAKPGSTIVAATSSAGGSRPRPRNGPRLTVMRTMRRRADRRGPRPRAGRRSPSIRRPRSAGSGIVEAGGRSAEAGEVLGQLGRPTAADPERLEDAVAELEAAVEDATGRGRQPARCGR